MPPAAAATRDRHLDARPGGPRDTGSPAASAGVRRQRDDGDGRDAIAGRAGGDRPVPAAGGRGAATRDRPISLVAARGGGGPRRDAAALRGPAGALQPGARELRPVLGRADAAQRERRRAAVGSRRGRVGRPARRRPAVRGPAAVVLSRSRARRRDPPRADAAAGQPAEPGGAHPRAARADGRARDRLVAHARGRPSGRRAAGPRGVAERRAAGARGGRARRRAPRVGAVATLDLGGHRRLLVDRPRRHRLDAGVDRRRQPAALVRLPDRHRGPASDAVAARRR